MVLFCVALCFLIHPYLTICELFSPLSENLLLIVYVFICGLSHLLSLFLCKPLDLVVSTTLVIFSVGLCVTPTSLVSFAHRIFTTDMQRLPRKV